MVGWTRARRRGPWRSLRRSRNTGDALVTHLASKPAGRYVNASVSVDLSYESVLARLAEERRQHDQRQAKATSARPRVHAAPALPSGDPGYAANPLADFYRASEAHRATYAAASSESAAPTLFESGDVPLVTASGMDPSVLRSLPWQARHPAAEAPTLQAAMRIVEDFSGPDADVSAQLEFAGHEGNRGYQQRMNHWLLSAPLAE